MPQSRVYPLIIKKDDPSNLDLLDFSQMNESSETLPLGNSFLLGDSLTDEDILEAKSLPKAVDMRPNMPAIIDQGSLGSCTACALCGLLGYLKKKQIFSRLFLYYCERAMINTINTDSGAYLSDGIKSLSNYGVCLETKWPYIIRKFKDKPTTDCYIQASSYKALQFKNINEKIVDLKTILAAGFPVVCGIAIFKSFESSVVTKTGVVPMPKLNEALLGGHAILLCGYDDVKKSFLFRNSWGTGWGIKGYGYLPYEFIEKLDWSTDFYTILKTT
jgi:C1A family cysteine protease